MYEIFEQLLQKRGVTAYRVAKETGVTQTALSNWKSGRSTPTTKTLQKIADYFGVTVDYLMTGKENTHPGENSLSARDQKDIAKKLDGILSEIDSNDSLMFDSGEIDDETREYLKTSLSLALTNAKIMAKEKYTPKKYRKTEEK